MQKIIIRDLALRCIIGIFPEERREHQDVIINITLDADLNAACMSDDIADTVDYKAIKQSVRHLVENSQFLLIEKLAWETAGVCLRANGVQKAVVTVDKPGALRFCRSVAVQVERERPPQED